ncbi:Pkinase-domain-containing protein [Macrolepiota fuliginosa MF-IS2]|uniref:non-specific serine/threonine protein kinase n=1 Tax=Macrolepiota fuliginosa MF-IS2 TaxID=1400762 RepID=A0A9P5XH14_9AGAR|nr:Pkinase-domain-containing protein [Macrolepiota fuliginosa MF-IS2]
MAAHPRRTIPRFGPYLLLQTLGEGEFGKVKLGIHVQWGEEVAVKLIRRGNVDNAVRLSKVEREIEVLRTLKHPNIVRLYDVIETDKYIGIILEYASGGELFDHILAHRYLKEKDAAKLFSQLISGVWYIHQKKIVHRDLKLENLLLDRNRNVIITDFGFANRFEHKADDLMQTSCGSPCYAAPELVISEGLYVGSAVDIWSCGVILYAMLAGYLPFDDDPANPDGDNINLLYKYIISTPLTFPEYMSSDARDLLSMMLVPDPQRRANLDSVMRHKWLSAHGGPQRTDGIPNAFGRSVVELEDAALEQHQQRRLAYQRQMRAAAVAQNNSQSPSSHRSNHGREATHPGVPNRSRSTQPEYLYDSSVDQSLLQSTSPSRPAASTTPNGSVTGKKPAYGSPSAHGITSDDPFAPPPGQASSSLGAAAAAAASSKVSEEKAPANGSATQSSNSNSKGHRQSGSGGGFRHTIQVEYDEPKSNRRSDERRGRSSTDHTTTAVTKQQQPTQIPQPLQPPPQQSAKDRRVSGSSTKPLPASPPVPTPAPVSASAPTSLPKPSTAPPPPSKIPTRSAAPHAPTSQQQQDIPTVSISKPATPDTNATSIPTPSDTREPAKDKDHHHQIREKDKDKETASTASATSSFSRKTGQGHKKGRSSVDKFGFVKIFGGGAGSPASPVVDSSTTATATSRVPSESGASASAASLLTASPEKEKEQKEKDGKEEKKKTRRNTLTVMVEPISRTIRGRSAKGSRTATLPAEPNNASVASLAPPMPSTPTPSSANVKGPQSAIVPAASAGSFNADESSVGGGAGEGTNEPNIAGSSNPASTSKARKVMAWFRTKSKGRDSMGILPLDSARSTSGGSGDEEQQQQQQQVVNVPPGPTLMVTTPMSTTTKIPGGKEPQTPGAPGHPKRSASTATENSVMTFSTPNFVQKFRNSVTVGKPSATPTSSKHHHHHHQGQQQQQQPKHPHEKLRIHHGAVDQTTITTRPPAEVMKHVQEILEGMGVEIMLESEYKYRCVRQKRRKGVVGVQPTQIGTGAPGVGVNGSVGAGAGTPGQGAQKEGDVAAFTMLGSAASNGVDKRGLPIPSQTSFGATGNMLRGLLMRRQSSQVSAVSAHQHQAPMTFDDEHSVVISPSTPTSEGPPSSNGVPVVMQETTYGDPSQDAGDEVRFSVELTRIDRLNDTFSLDIRRLKGNLRSYKFLYDTIRQRADLQRLGQ